VPARSPPAPPNPFHFVGLIVRLSPFALLIRTNPL
jgi:hypothetical protein